jgi:hypothetical protein
MESATDREIRHAVKFRIENPFEGPDMSLPSSWKAGVDMSDPFVVGVLAGQRQNKELVATVLARYGK